MLHIIKLLLGRPLWHFDATRATRVPQAEIEDTASRNGGLITYGGVPIDWWSTKQLSIATSSGGAEGRALSTVVQKGLQLQHIAQELNIQTLEQLQTYCDAEAAIGFAKNNGGGSKMEHLDARLGWAQQNRERGQIKLLRVARPPNPADFFMYKGYGQD